MLTVEALLPYVAGVTAVLSSDTVKVFVAPAVVIALPPAIVNVSLSKSMLNAPPESPWKSRSSAVSCVSTYALTLCCVGILVALSEAILSSSTNQVPFILASTLTSV